MQTQSPFATVTSALDGDVLTVLARARKAFAVSDLGRMIPGRSGPGIRKTLERLVGQGVVLTNAVGRSFTYELNREHLAAEAIVALAELTDELYDRLKVAVAGLEPNLKYAAVFGSAATREMRPTSDIDLFFVQRGESVSPDFEESVRGIAYHAHRWTGNDVRPLILAESEVGTGNPVLSDVMEEGLVLFGDRMWLARSTGWGLSANTSR